MRKRVKIPLISLLLIALIIGGAIIALYKSHILENWANRYLATRLAAQYGLDIKISEIDGSFVHGFELKDVLIRLHREKDTVNLAFLPRVRIRYQASNLWDRRWIIDSLSLTRPVLNLTREKSGKWALPKLSAGAGRSPKSMPSWQIKSLNIIDAELEMALGDSSLFWYDIDLSATAISEEDTYTINLDTLRFNSSDGRLRVNHASGKATLFENNLILQNIFLTTDSSKAAFSMVLDNREETGMEAHIDSAHIHLPDIVTFLGSGMKGDLDLAGEVYRQFGKTGGDLLISGSFQKRLIDSLQVRFHYDQGYVYIDTLSGTVLGGGTIDGFGGIDLAARPRAYHLNARVDSLNLNNIVFNSFVSDLSGRVILDGRGFNLKTMVMDLDLDLDESYFDIYHFHRGRGQMTVTTSALHFFPGFQIFYHDNRFTFGGDLDYHDSLEIEGQADLSDLSNFAHQTFIDLPAGRARAEFLFSGPTRFPNLSGSLRSDSIWLYDFYSQDFRADFDLIDFVGRKQGPITLAAYDGEAWKFPYDSLSATFTLDSNLLVIDTAGITNRFSGTNLTGVLDFESYPQVLTLDRVNLDLTDRPFVSDGNQVILIDSSGFIFEQININTSDGRMSFSGRADYDETLDLAWNLDRIAIAPWAIMINDSLYLEGKLSSTGTAVGTFEKPVFNLDFGIDSLVYRAMHLGDLSGYLTYYDSVLHIDSSYLTSPEGLYSAAGEFPINLALMTDRERFDGRQQRIVVSATDKRLDLVAFLLESIEYMTGDFSAEFVLTGTPLKPHLNGTSSLKDGIVKLIDLRNRLENVEVKLTMADQLITIDTLHAEVPHKKSKTPGNLSGRGAIFIEDINNFIYTYNEDTLRLICHDLPIDYELGKFTGRADADLIVSGPTPPTVTGTIRMHSAFYRENFTEAESGFNLLTALEGDNTWNLDLMVECPSNAWVKNDDIDAEFSGSINILRNAGVYNFLGTLEIIRGKYYVFAKTFSLSPGGQIIYENIEEPDPRLNLEMSTRIRSQNPYPGYDGEDDYSFELELLVTGTLEKPLITGTGDTPLSTEEILPALWGGYQSSGVVDSASNGSGAADPFTQGVGDLLASQFTRIGTRTLGVETFEIAPGSGKFDPLGARVTIGKYTLPNLYIFGSSSLDVEKGQEVGAEYRLGRHYFFEGRRDENNLYHFSLKYFVEW